LNHADSRHEGPFPRGLTERPHLGPDLHHHIVQRPQDHVLDRQARPHGDGTEPRCQWDVVGEIEIENVDDRPARARSHGATVPRRARSMQAAQRAAHAAAVCSSRSQRGAPFRAHVAVARARGGNLDTDVPAVVESQSPRDNGSRRPAGAALVPRARAARQLRGGGERRGRDEMGQRDGGSDGREGLMRIARALDRPAEPPRFGLVSRTAGILR
jgi:hypothetical protein